MSDPIREMYEQRKSATADRLRLLLSTDDDDEGHEQDDEPQQSAPKPSDIDQGSRGGPVNFDGDKSSSQRASEFLRKAYRKTKTGSQQVLVDMSDKWPDDD